MRIGVMGIHAKSSELDFRERFAKIAEELFGSEATTPWAESTLLLSTCHRIEIYFSGAAEEMIAALRERLGPACDEHLYIHFEEACFHHLATVVSGLDSIVIGETEIQRQIKRAYENALIYRTLSSPLHFLFQKSFKIAKEVRSAPFFPRGHLTLEGSVFQLFKQMLSPEDPVLFIGNSAINRKIIRFFQKKGVPNLSLCTRSLHSALELGVTLLDWSAISSWKAYPMLICGTNQPEYLISVSSEAMQTRLIVDLCVPRNVDPEIAKHAGVTLFNITEISRFLQAKAGKHDAEIAQCKERVKQLVDRQLSLFDQRAITVRTPSQ